MVIQMLREHQLFSKLEKCEFWLEQVVFLGHVVLKVEMKVDSLKVKTVSEWLRQSLSLKLKTS